MKQMVVLIGLAAALSAAIAVAQTPSRWVDRTKADIRAGRGSFYEIVDTVIKGDKVDIVKTEDRWLYVTGAKGVYAQQYARQKGYDYSVVMWIEQNQPTPDEFDRFIKDGGLAAAGGR